MQFVPHSTVCIVPTSKRLPRRCLKRVLVGNTADGMHRQESNKSEKLHITCRNFSAWR